VGPSICFVCVSMCVCCIHECIYVLVYVLQTRPEIYIHKFVILVCLLLSFGKKYVLSMSPIVWPRMSHH
jgi:hypothetical protein